MKDNIKRFIIKLFSLTLAIILAVPAQIFAQSTEKQKTTTYRGESSVMGINPNPQPSATATDITTNIPAVLESEKTADQVADYYIEKSANLDTQTKEITYRIALTPKEIKELDPFANIEYITAAFAQNDNVDHKDLRLEKVTHLDENGTESQIREKTTKPNILNAPKNITTFSTKAAKPQYGMVYYLTAKVDDKVIENLGKGKTSPSFAIDMQIQDHDQTPFYNNRYALTTDTDANLLAMDEAKAEHLIGGLYAGEVNAILTTFPATITWTDFIFAPKEKELIYDIKLDENQDTTNTEIKVEYYQARDNGFAINNSFTQRIPYTNSLKIQIPEGQLAKVVLQTTVKTDKTIDTYSFNGKKIANLAREGASDSQPTEEGEADDEDPAGADTSDITFTDQSGIELNSQSLIENYEAAGQNTEENINFIKTTAQALENYNNETTDWDQFIDALSVAIGAYGVDQATTAEVVDHLISGLSQDKYKVANIDPAEAAKLAYEKANGQAEATSESADTKEVEKEKPEEIKTTVSTDSGIELNKQSLIEKIKAADKADANTMYFIKSASEALITYNAETIDYNQFLDQLSTAASTYKIDEADMASYVDDLVAGLNEDNYKVVNLNGAEVAKDATALNYTSTSLDGEENVEVDGGAEFPSDKTVDELVKEKLEDPNTTLEDFQNYMYELEEKYGLTDEDADRIYAANDEAIQALIAKHRDENIDPLVLAEFDGFQNKKFQFISNMNALAIPQWQIPKGWYFDIEVSDNIKREKSTPIPDLKDASGRTVATGTWRSLYVIRYTFTTAIDRNTSVPINLMYDFRTTSNNPETIKIVINPKDGYKQYMPPLVVYPDSAQNPSEDNKGVVKSLYVIDRWSQSQTIGTHISKNIGDRIRYSFAKDNDFVNTYEKAIASYDDGDLSYYLWLQPESDGRIPSDTDITITMSGSGSIDKVEIFEVPELGTEIYKEKLKDSSIVEDIQTLREVTTKSNTVNVKPDKVDIKFDDDYMDEGNRNSYIVKVTTKDVKANQEVRFGFKWSTSKSGTIDNLNNPYTISINYDMPSIQDEIIDGSTNGPIDLSYSYDGNRYNIVRGTNGQIQQLSNGLAVYCLNHHKPNPFEYGNAYYQKAIVNPSPEVFGSLAYPPGLDSDNVRDNVAMLNDIKRAIYLADKKTDWSSNYQKYHVTQALIYRIIDIYTVPLYRTPDGRDSRDEKYKTAPIDSSVYAIDSNENPTGYHGKKLQGYNIDYGTNSERQFIYGNYGQTLEFRDDTNKLFFKIPRTKNPNDSLYISDTDLNSSVTIKVYQSFNVNTHALEKGPQNAISYEVIKRTTPPTPTPKTGEFYIYKKDSSNNQPLGQVTFELWDANGYTRLQSETTASNGSTKNFTGLKANTSYRLVEVNRADYEHPGYYWNVSVDANGNVTIADQYGKNKSSGASLRYEISNKPIEKVQPKNYSIRVRKVDSENRSRGLQNVRIGIYSDAKARNLVDWKDTDSQGYAEFTGLTEGKYYLKEISGITGYENTLINLSGDDKGTGIIEVYAGGSTTVTADTYYYKNASYPNNGVNTVFGNQKITAVDQNTFSMSMQINAYNYFQKIKFAARDNVSSIDNVSYTVTENNSNNQRLNSWSGTLGNLPRYYDNGAQTYVRSLEMPKSNNSYGNTRYFIVELNNIPHNLSSSGRAAILMDVTDDAVGYNQSFVGADIKISNTTSNQLITLGNKPVTKPKYGFTLEKKDSFTNQSIRNVEFELSKAANFVNGYTVAKLSTDSQGIINFGDLEPGAYYLRETTTPSGYETNSKIYRVVINDDGTLNTSDSYQYYISGGYIYRENDNNSPYRINSYNKTLTVGNTPKTGDFSFKKISSDGSALTNATFTLTDSNGNVSTSPTKYNNGVHTFTNLPIGNYVLEETKAPSGHKLPTNEADRKWNVNVYLDNNNNVSVRIKKYNWSDYYYNSTSFNSPYEIKNEKITGKFKLKKVDENGNALTGAKFALRDANKIRITQVYQTNANGELYISNLENGKTYYLEEVETPTGYTTVGDRYTKIVVNNGNVTVEEKKPASSNTGTINPVNPQPTPQPTPIPEPTPAKNWSSTTNLVRHSKWPGYMNAQDYTTVTNPSTKEVVTYIMLKPDQPIAGDGGTNRDTYITISGSNATIKKLELYQTGNSIYKANMSNAMTDQEVETKLGTTYNGYTYSRLQAWDWNSSSIQLDLTANNFTNDKSYLLKVTSTVTNPSNEASVKYEWRSKEATESHLPVQTTRIPANVTGPNATADSRESVLDSLLAAVVPTAHAAALTPTISTSGDSSYQEFKIYNVPNKITIVKTYDGNNNSQFNVSVVAANTLLPIANNTAYFKLTKSDDSYFNANNYRVGTGNTVTFTKLPAGDYTFEERQAPKGYDTSNTKITFSVNKDGTITRNGEVLDQNQSITYDNTKTPKAKLTIRKTDGTKALTGARFALYKQIEGTTRYETLSREYTRDANKIIFDNLEKGNYRLVEEKAPDGHMISLDTWNVRVDENGNVNIKKNSRPEVDYGMEIEAGAPIPDSFANYSTASNSLGVVTELTAPTEINYHYEELINGNISQDEYERKLKAIVDSLDLSKRDFQNMVEPIVEQGDVYESATALASNVYALEDTFTNQGDVNTLLTSAYQDIEVDSGAPLFGGTDWTSLLRGNTRMYTGTTKVVPNFVTLTDAKLIAPTTGYTVRIGETDFNFASREGRPNIFRTEDGETVFCIDLNVENPNGTNVKSQRIRVGNTIPALNTKQPALNEDQVEKIKMIFYYQQELAREHGLDVTIRSENNEHNHRDQDKIDLYAAIQANIFLVTKGQPGYDAYVEGKSVQNLSPLTPRAKMLADELKNKLVVKQAEWKYYQIGDWVTLTYFKPDKARQRTVTAFVDNPVEIQKVSLDGKPLAGAGFTIYTTDSYGNKTNTIATDKDGKQVVFPVPGRTNVPQDLSNFKARLNPGIYVLSETKVPDGYSKMPDIKFTVHTRTHTETQDVIQLQYPWDYSLAKKENKKVVTTYERSYITIDPSQANYLVSLDETDDAKIYVANTKKETPKPSIDFVKTNTNYEILPDVEFELRKSGMTPIKVVANKQGVFSFADLDNGNYEVYETKNPNKGYESNANLSTPVVRFTVENGEIKSGIEINGKTSIGRTESGHYVITNDYTSPKTDIKFTKANINTGRAIGGGRFELQKLTGNGYVTVQSTSASSSWFSTGSITFTGLEDGRYRLWEVEAPSNYDLPANRALANFLVEGGKVATIRYAPIDGQIYGKTVGSDYYVYNKPYTPPTTEFTITKTDQFGNALDGVTFNLYKTDNNGNIIRSNPVVQTIQGGQTTFMGLEANKVYVVEEASVPTGHEASNEMIAIKIVPNPNNNKEYNIEILDEVKLGKDAIIDIANPPNEIEFEKVDSNSKEKLVGVEFVLKETSGTGQNPLTRTTADGGKFRFDKLKDGRYELFETVALKGYQSDPNKAIASFWVTKGRINSLNIQNKNIDLSVPTIKNRAVKNRLEVTNIKNPGPFEIGNIKEPETPGISFKKVDSETKEGIPGVQLGLYDLTRKAYVVPVGNEHNSLTKATTDNNGIIRYINLKDGDYVLDEFKSAVGYVNRGEDIIKITVKDGKVTAKSTRQKDGSYIAIADDKLINGHIPVENDKEHPRAKFSINKMVESTGTGSDAYKKLYKARFSLLIQDSKGKYVRYFPKDTTGYNNPRMTDAYGNLEFDELEVGRTYYLVEDDPNPIYKRMNLVWVIQVDNEGKVTVTISEPNNKENDLFEKTSNKILFVKEDKDGNRLDVAPISYNDLKNAGEATDDAFKDYAVFELWRREDPSKDYEPFDTVEGNQGTRMVFNRDEINKGLFGWSNLPSGDYKVKEVKAPTGYRINPNASEERYKDELANGFVASFVVDPGQNIINVSKIASFNGKLAPDYENEINTITNRGTKISTTTDGSDNPVINITNEYLPPIVVTNVEDYKDVEFNKVSLSVENNKEVERPLEGASFRLYSKSKETDTKYQAVRVKDANDNEEKDYIATSDKDGRVTFKKLKEGFYAIEEISAPSKFAKLDGYAKEFKVDAKGNLLVKSGNSYEARTDQNVKVVNRHNEIEFTKVDSGVAKTPLDGAKFQLYKEDNSKVGEVKTSANGGKFRWTGLEAGNYYVKEEEAAEGYITPTGDKAIVARFSVDSNTGKITLNQGYKSTIENSKLAKFKLIKTNENWEKLEGAEFTLTPQNIDGMNTQKLVINITDNKEQTYHVFDNLKPGDYILKETNAPSTYYAPPVEWTVHVDTNGKVSIKADKDEYKDDFFRYGEETINGEKVITLTVKNAKVEFPSTGGNGVTIAFALIGTAVMLAGIAYYGIYINNKNRRRSDRYVE